MNEKQYCDVVRSVLDAQFEIVKKRLSYTFECIPEAAREVLIGIHVDQDGEGFLTIRVHLDGPDLYILNKKISESAELFDTVMGVHGLEPPLPLMCAGNEDFMVTDVLSDCAVSWISDNWEGFKISGVLLPVVAVSMEGYGDLGVVQLHSPSPA